MAWLLNNGDWEKWIQDGWRVGVTAAQLMAMRPAQIIATFYRVRSTADGDPLTQLIADNDARGKKGLPPLCPPFFKQLLAGRTR